MPGCKSPVFRESHGLADMSGTSGFGACCVESALSGSVSTRQTSLVHKAQAKLGEIIRLGPDRFRF